MRFSPPPAGGEDTIPISVQASGIVQYFLDGSFSLPWLHILVSIQLNSSYGVPLQFSRVPLSCLITNSDISSHISLPDSSQCLLSVQGNHQVMPGPPFLYCSCAALSVVLGQHRATSFASHLLGTLSFVAWYLMSWQLLFHTFCLVFSCFWCQLFSRTTLVTSDGWFVVFH